MPFTHARHTQEMYLLISVGYFFPRRNKADIYTIINIQKRSAHIFICVVTDSRNALINM